MQKKIHPTLRFLVLLCLISGCGGEEETLSLSTSPTELPPSNLLPSEIEPFALAPEDTLAARAKIPGISTRFTAPSTRITNDFDASSAEASGTTAPEILFATNDTGDLTLTLSAFGEDTPFEFSDLDPSHANEFQKTLADGKTTIYLWTFEDSWKKAIEDNSDYKYLVGFGSSKFNTDTLINDRAYGVFGLATRATALTSLPNATYAGNVIMDAYLSNDPDALFQIYGDLDLTVDFGSSAASGRIDQLLIGDLPQTSAFLIQNGTITENQITATLDYDPATCIAAGCGTISSGALNGTFFGNAAQEAGGPVGFSGTSSDGFDYIAAGIWQAKK